MPRLLSEGKLDRTRRALDRATGLCPEQAAEAWAAQIEVLDALGDGEAVARLAATVLSAPAAPEAARKAAQEVKNKAARAPSPSPTARERARRAFEDAAAAFRSKDHERAYRGALAAWAESPPAPEALVVAGRAALAKGDHVEARRLFDRAMSEAARIASPAPEPSPPPSLDLVPPTNALRRITALPGEHPLLAAQAEDGGVTLLSLERGYGPTIGLSTLTPRRPAFSPDGKRLFVLGPSSFTGPHGTILAYDAASAALERVLPLPSSDPRWRSHAPAAFAISPDGKRASMHARGVSMHDYALWIYDIEKERLAASSLFDSPVNAMTFTADGRLLALRHFIEGGQFGKEDAIRLYDAASGKRVRRLGTKEDEGPQTDALATSPDGALVAAFAGKLDESAEKATLHLFDVKTGKERAACAHSELGETQSASIAFSPDGEVVAALFPDRIRLWDSVSCAEKPPIAVGRRLDDFAFIDAGHVFTLGEDGYRIWDRRNGAISRDVARPLARVNAVAFSPDEKRIAWGLEDGSVALWDSTSASSLRRLHAHTGAVNKVAFSPTGATLITGGDDARVALWEASSGKPARTLAGHGDSVEYVGSSPDGSLLVSASDDKTVRLWDARTGALLRTLTGAGSGFVTAAFSRDGALLATGAFDGAIRIHATATGALRRELTGPKGRIDALRFTGEGALWSWSADRTLRRWDIESGKVAFEQKGKSAARFSSITLSPDGKQLAATGLSASGVSLLDAASGAPLRLLRASRYAVQDLIDVAFSPDGRLLAAASLDGSLYLFRTDAESPALTVRVAEGLDAAIAFTEDGYIEILGADADRLRRITRCSLGLQWFPFEVCEERLTAPGLFAKVLQGDTSFREP